VLSAGSYSWRQKFEILPRVLPFILIILGVLYAMYGGVATPSETAAVGALLCLLDRDGHLPAVEPARSVGRAARQHQGIGDDPVHHRGGRRVLLHAVLALHHPVDRGLDRHARREPLGADGRDQHVPADRRVLSCRRSR
jgi:hypothetical protein